MVSTRSPEAAWSDIILIYLIGVFGMLVVSAAVPALGGIAAEFRPPSPATVGWVMSMPALAAAVSSLFVGWAVDRHGARPLMTIGAALVVAGDAGVVASGTMGTLLAWRVVGGLGYVCVVVAAVTMIARLTSGGRRTAALALWSTVIPASFILSSLYGAATGQAFGWRAVFVVHACGTAALVLVGWLVLPHRTAAGPSRLSDIGAVLRTPGPFMLGISFAAAAFLQTGFVATLPMLLGRGIGAGEAEVHFFTGAAMLCNIAGAFLFGLLTNRDVAPWRIGLGAVVLCAIAGAGLVLAPTALGPALAMDCGLMLGLGFLVGMWALLPAVAPSPAHMGATSGLITQITLLGVLFGPPAAFTASVAGSHGSLLFLAVGAALSLTAWPVWRRAATPAEPAIH